MVSPRTSVWLVELLCLAANVLALVPITCSDLYNESKFVDFAGGKAKGVVVDEGIARANTKAGFPFEIAGVKFIGCRGDTDGNAITSTMMSPSGTYFLGECAPDSFFCTDENDVLPGGDKRRQTISFGTSSTGTGTSSATAFAQLYMCIGVADVADCAPVPVGQSLAADGSVPCCDGPGGKCSTPLNNNIATFLCARLGYPFGSEEATSSLPPEEMFCPDGIGTFGPPSIFDYENKTTGFSRKITCFVDIPIPSPPSSPPALPPAVPVYVKDDPHFFGADGDRFDFAGANNTVYSLFSASHLALNALFMKTTFVMGHAQGPTCPYCKLKTVHGSFVKVAYFRALTAAGKTVLIEYRADEPSHALLSVEDVEGGAPPEKTEVKCSKFKEDSVQYTVDNVAVQLVRKHYREAAITVSTGDFELKAASMHLAWAEQNKYQKRLDVSIMPRRVISSLKVAPHGLIGQTFDGDSMAVDGALDDYSSNEVVTKAMAEGAIEGVASDYEISRADPFSTTFKYDRFSASSAAPRDVSKLTGVHRKAGRHGEAAGTIGDDTLVMSAEK